MKNLTRLLPLLALAPFTHAQEVDIDDASGYIAPLTINLTLSETTGGYAISPEKKTADDAKGITYPDLATFQTTYQPDSPLSAIINPFGWDTTEGNNYVERVTTNSANPDAPVITAAGTLKITRTRYTNATLLADLVAANEIASASGYRLVAVRFNVSGDSHYETPTHVTDVNNGYYFFAEAGPNDPDPIYLGAERDEMFPDEKFVDFTRSITAKAGKYLDIFTGDPIEGGFDYTLKSESYKGTTLADFTFYRPVANEAFYLITAEGLFNWTENFDRRRELMAPGPINGSGLIGPAQGYTHTEEAGYVANSDNRALVSGSVKIGKAAFAESMIKYMNKLPPTMETHEEEEPGAGDR